MGFLKESLLQKQSAIVAEDTHLLIKEGNVPLNIKQLYLQGCILAVLEREDGQIDASAKSAMMRLGSSLQMTNDDITDSLAMVQGLKAKEDQENFLKELVASLSSQLVWVKFFMKDVEKILKKKKKLFNLLEVNSMSPEARNLLDYFGVELTGKSEWRQALDLVDPSCQNTQGQLCGSHLLNVPNAISVGGEHGMDGDGDALATEEEKREKQLKLMTEIRNCLFWNAEVIFWGSGLLIGVILFCVMKFWHAYFLSFGLTILLGIIFLLIFCFLDCDVRQRGGKDIDDKGEPIEKILGCGIGYSWVVYIVLGVLVNIVKWLCSL